MSADEDRADTTTGDKSWPKIVFTEKEENVLKAAWHCLKSGPPEIDMKKLVKLGDFNTEKTAANTWGVIKKKLFAGGSGSASASASPAPATAKTKKGTAQPLKRVKAEDDSDGSGSSTPSKKARKATPRKTAVRATVEEEDEDSAEVGA